MRALLASLIAVATTLTAARASAWNDFGHMQVAAVAYTALDAKDRKRAHELLKLNPSYAQWIVGARSEHQRRAAFLRAATWADAVKADPAYSDGQAAEPNATQIAGYSDHFRHGNWHYINVPFSIDGTATLPAPTPNVATMISALRAALAAKDTSDEVKSYALVWLLHLVGDIHQPLHCVARFDREHPSGDRGGNLIEIAGNRHHAPCDDPRYCPHAPPTTLHAYVDSVLGSTYAIAPALDAAAALPAPNPKQAALLEPEIWVQEGVQLARTEIYVAPISSGRGPFVIDRNYDAAVTQLARQRIALAGVRLAKLLRAAF